MKGPDARVNKSVSEDISEHFLEQEYQESNMPYMNLAVNQLACHNLLIGGNYFKTSQDFSFYSNKPT